MASIAECMITKDKFFHKRKIDIFRLNESISLDRMPLMKPKSIFILALLLVVAVNLAQSFDDLLDLYSKRQKNPFFFSGYIFQGLENIFKDIKYVGYYTDKSLDENPAAAKFAQAQYMLAPTILDLNSTDHEFILFDCSREEIARQKIKEINATALKKNKFGIILARRLTSIPLPNPPHKPRLWRGKGEGSKKDFAP